MKGIIRKATRRTTSKAKPLPKGFKAAAPVKNKALRDLLSGPDVASGGAHAVVEGRALLNGQASHR